MRKVAGGLGACVVALSATLASGQVPIVRRRPPPPAPMGGAATPPEATSAVPPAAPAAPVTTATPVTPKISAAKGRWKPKEPPPPIGPTPAVKLTLDAPTPRGTWTMRVTNEGDIPLRLVADARLLVLEVTPRGATKPVRCELPADMRPGDDMERPLVLPPGRSYVESFEPRLYCFGQHLLDALAQGSIVVGRLGWLGGNKERPPFEVASIAGVEPELAPLKDIASPPIGLPDEASATLETAPARRPDDPDPATLTLRGPGSIDAQRAPAISVTVTLHNGGKRAVIVRLRPETLRFAVTAPRGPEDCGWPLSPVAAMHELFSTVPPGGNAELNVLLDAYCTGHSFDLPGLVVVRPELDTRKASGAEIALRTFDGRVVATSPTVVRLHQGLQQPHLQHPHLEPLPTAFAPSAAPSASSAAPPSAAPSASSTSLH